MAAAPQHGWSIRAVARSAGLSQGSLRNLMRPELALWTPGDVLGPRDVLLARVLTALGSNRPSFRVNGTLDVRTAGLLARDRMAAEVLRAVDLEALSPATRLLATDDRVWITQRDADVLIALEDHPAGALLVLPLGVWGGQLVAENPQTRGAAA
jgi:hypothetical protein